MSFLSSRFRKWKELGQRVIHRSAAHVAGMQNASFQVAELVENKCVQLGAGHVDIDQFEMRQPFRAPFMEISARFIQKLMKGATFTDL